MSDDTMIAPKKKTGLIITIVAGVVVVAAGGVAVAMMKGGHIETADTSKTSEKKLGPLIQFEDFIVNLNEPRSTRYLKVRFSLELGDAKGDLIAERKDVIRDSVLTYLSGLTVDDVRGSETKAALREEVLERVNTSIGVAGGVRSVLFTEFVVQ